MNTEEEVTKLETPAKDTWDKLGVIAGLLGSVAIPLVLVIAGYYVQKSLSDILRQEQHGEKLVEIAAAVLSANPESHAARPEIRDWAVAVLNHYSEVPLSKEAESALKEVPLVVPDIASESRVELFSKELGATGQQRDLYRGARITKY